MITDSFDNKSPAKINLTRNENAVKADAVQKALYNDATNLIPATVMKAHDDFTLFVDEDSFGKVEEEKIRPAEGHSCTIERK